MAEKSDLFENHKILEYDCDYHPLCRGIGKRQITFYNDEIVVDEQFTELYDLDIWSTRSDTVPEYCKDGRELHLQLRAEEGGRHYCKLDDNSWVQIFDKGEEMFHSVKKHMSNRPISISKMKENLQEYFDEKYWKYKPEIIYTEDNHP